jgi:SAM-dependent methyltransferase
MEDLHRTIAIRERFQLTVTQAFAGWEIIHDIGYPEATSDALVRNQRAQFALMLDYVNLAKSREYNPEDVGWGFGRFAEHEHEAAYRILLIVIGSDLSPREVEQLFTDERAEIFETREPWVDKELIENQVESVTLENFNSFHYHTWRGPYSVKTIAITERVFTYISPPAFGALLLRDS